MGKKKNKNNKQQQGNNNSYFEPKSSPPATAPPVPPPPQYYDGGGAETDALMSHVSYGSYQSELQQQQQQAQLRDQVDQAPTSTSTSTATSSAYYYQDDNVQRESNSTAGGVYMNSNNRNSLYSGFGDSTLRPNTGEANWMDDEILGLSLHEILKTLQWSNIITCASAIVLELLVAIFRIFRPTKFILGCYLAFFASIVLRVEIAHIIKQHRSRLQFIESLKQITTTNNNNNNNNNNNTILEQQEEDELHDLIGASYSKVPNVEVPALRDNFGLVFHPSGKACVLYLMASMCIGQSNNLLEDLLGVWFGINGTIILYLMWQYPAYRRQEDIPVPKLPPLPNSSDSSYRNGIPGHSSIYHNPLAVLPNNSSWQYYENDASSVWQVATTIAEGASMLNASGRNFR